MGNKKRTGKKIRKLAPPPTHRARQLALKENKPFLVSVISLIILFFLVLLNFLPSQFTGMTSYVTPAGNEVNIELINSVIVITADTAVTVSGAYFELSSQTSGINICDIYLSAENRLWGDFDDVSCKNEKLIFSDATLDEDSFKSGKFTIAEINLNLDGISQLELNLNPVDVYDASNGNDLFPDGQVFTIDVPSEDVAITEEDEEETTAAETPSSGGGGRRCTSDWSCGYWSVCDLSLTQTRTCIDLNNCVQTRTETKTCTHCTESWVCSLWSDCLAKKQTRKCYDERQCGTIVKKPALQRACNAPVAGPTPTKIISVPPTQFTIPIVEMPRPTFWDEYGFWIITIPIILVLLALAIILILHFKKPKEETTNFNALRMWVKNALAKGASKERIRKIIQPTNWTDKELDRAFKEVEQDKK